MFGPRAFYFASNLKGGLRPSLGQKLIMIAVLPILLLLIPIVGLIAFFSLRKLSRGAKAPNNVFDSDSVITVSKIEKSERLLESS